MKFIKSLQEKLYQIQQLNISQYLCIEQEFSKTSILLWLKAQKSATKIYWSEKDDLVEIGMLDICHQISDMDDPSRIMQAPYFGGIGFDVKTSTWQEFGYCRFILPRISLCRVGKHYTIKCHLDCRKNSVEQEVQACLTLLEQLQPSALFENKQKQNTLITRQETPNKALWTKLVDQALLAEKQKLFSKVVLSRESTLTFEQPIDTWELLTQWQALNSNCFQFLFQYEHNKSFMGCSPERLYLRSGSRLTTESLAGTTLRGNNEEEDLAFSNALLNEPKLRRENTLVLEDILSRLDKLSQDIGVDEVVVLKLNRIQHLKQRIHSYLRDEVTDATLIKELHPTPAVGGSPRDLTMNYILANEPYDRGWYAGAVGYISEEKSELCVAIRSALIDQQQIKLYAGAGIVEGSYADLEWHELDNKISSVLALLNVN